MLMVIVATGNHFFVDAALGGLVAVAAWLAARALVKARAERSPAALRALPALAPQQPFDEQERLAA